MEREQVSDNIERYKKLIGCYASDDIAGLRNLVDADIIMENPAPANSAISGNRHGRDAFLDYLTVAGSPTAEFLEFGTHAWFENDGHVIALGHEKCRILSTGKISETYFVHETKWRNGKVYFWREYYDTAGLQAAYTPDPEK